jgi:hypothetical protein
VIALLALLWAAQENVCHVELPGLEIRNSELEQALVANGVLLNRSPLELNSVSLEISLYADNGVKFRSLQRIFLSKLAPRRGAPIELKEAPLGTIALGSWRAKLGYRIEDKEYSFDFEGPRLKTGKYYEDPEGGTRLGLAGLRTIAGSTQKQPGSKATTYTGDVLFLRLRIEGMDDKDRPQGTLEVTLTAEGKKRGPLKRTIDSASWKMDARQLPTNDADPRMIAWDAVSRELLVGLVRLDDERRATKMTLEAKFTWKKQTWIWSALEPPFAEAPRPSDKK